MFLATLYAVSINAFPHRHDDSQYGNYGFVSCESNIPRELDVSYTPNPLVSNVNATFEVAGRLLIDAPTKFFLHIIVYTDILEYHDTSDVEPARHLKAGELFNFYETFTMPTLSEHYKIQVSLDSLDTTLACANATI
ncbi:4856_t:CDS:1 [Paraglomus occultum]|uniref:4856_t:CDS:1 n=1 Tax=Paraglomus occultum TaxID=144539 RepID=A0A9N9AVW1_9GLOM|nr:4856_t:CDS:1 [Paraglomus occultum]